MRSIRLSPIREYRTSEWKRVYLEFRPLGIWPNQKKDLVFRFWGIVIVEFVFPRLIQSLEALERLWADRTSP